MLPLGLLLSLDKLAQHEIEGAPSRMSLNGRYARRSNWTSKVWLRHQARRHRSGNLPRPPILLLIDMASQSRSFLRRTAPLALSLRGKGVRPKMLNPGAKTHWRVTLSPPPPCDLNPVLRTMAVPQVSNSPELRTSLQLRLLQAELKEAATSGQPYGPASRWRPCRRHVNRPCNLVKMPPVLPKVRPAAPSRPPYRSASDGLTSASSVHRHQPRPGTRLRRDWGCANIWIDACVGRAMSNYGAIAAVTQALQNMLTAGLRKVDSDPAPGGVTTEPLDKLAAQDGNPALNLHLYQILPNAHWRSMDIPWKVKPGETGHAPLALDLRYLLTATKPATAQRDLGIGMRVLHDNPVIDPGGAAINPFERARVSMQPLSLDDMEKLWTGVSAPRLLSVAYEVSVVLIESEVPTRSALPVLTRGTGSPDSIEVQAGLSPQYPTIERIEVGDRNFDTWLRNGSKPSRTDAQINDKIFIYGQGLISSAKAIVGSLLHPRKSGPLDLIANDRGGLTLDLALPEFRATNIPAGPCSIVLQIEREKQKEDDIGIIDSTNAMTFSFAPTITSIAPHALSIPGDIVVEFAPPLVNDQAVALIIGNRQVRPKNGVPAAGDSFVVFRLEVVDADSPEEIGLGKYPVRLRVDDVNSVVVDLEKKILSSERPTFSSAFVVEVKK
ncbi:DUF4255 domain-containing protein [Rhizobium leguminosarum bv. viciae]|nr:DUF4255 domain-containing protein [Rhizobium leguminosarum bv. viciae]TBZ54204.1 DUF4255 domain-containing protein [Rhizobium leguminosarum bv. viciae]